MVAYTDLLIGVVVVVYFSLNTLFLSIISIQWIFLHVEWREYLLSSFDRFRYPAANKKLISRWDSEREL